MSLISCASYYGSGSSAFTDLVSEYDGVKSLTDYEFRFVHDIDGISDLEFHLVECPNRHNSGHALKRFWKLSKFNHGKWFNARYEPFFGGKYLELTKQYVDELTDFKYPAYWFYDMYDRGNIFYYTKSLQNKLYRKLKITKSVMPDEITFGSHPTQEKFIHATQKYLQSLFIAANPEEMPYLMMDQILPSSNVNRCLRYFPEDTKLVIVDRDPRDIYLSEKLFWHEDVAPHDVNAFCQWFDYTHSCSKGEMMDENKVLKINFEDLIYKYNETMEKIERFLGFKSDNHTNPFEGFNPKRSIVNTQLWKRNESPEEMEVIRVKLPQYLYDFESVKGNYIPGKDIKDAKNF